MNKCDPREREASKVVSLVFSKLH